MPLEWRFKEHGPGDEVTNPLGGEHFNNQGAAEDSDWKPGESLVREAIQNSLDARTPGDEASVCFHVSEPAAMSAEAAAYWFGSLWPHLCAKECKIRQLPQYPDAGGFILVEDFGTHGLEGRVDQWQIPREGESNDFFSFFRAEGLSGKTDRAGGSWGVGKSVFNRCSAINSLLALTVRRSERNALVFGRSVLWHHRVMESGQEREYQATGRLGVPDPEHPNLILPYANQSVLDRLKRDFQVKRPVGVAGEGEPEPGLSVIIPYSDPEITADKILDIVLREYFYPILCGSLRVRISGRGLNQSSVEIDCDSIASHIRQVGRQDLLQVLDLAMWGGQGAGASLELRAPAKRQAPSWSEDLLPKDSEAYKSMCDRFDDGDPVSLKIPLHVHEVSNGATAIKTSHFTLLLRKDLDGDGYRPVFVRGDIVVPNVRQRVVRGHSLFALILIEDQPLASMLRAAEPPSHDSWSHETQNFRGLYDHGQATIEFVRSAPKWLADFLSQRNTERDVLALADFFPEPDDEGRQPDAGAGKRGRKKVSPPEPPPPARPTPFRITDTDGGFRIVRDNAGTTPLPESVEVRAAYDTSRGNPMSAYHPADFELKSLPTSLVGAELLECDGNRLVVAPLSDEFSLEISGFDENRDLLVKVRTADPTDSGGAEQ